jgi:SPP1 family predicted phage head-tail adaptor
MVGPKVKIIHQRCVLTSDGAGGFSESWTDIGTLRGSLMLPKGSERTDHDRMEVSSTHTFYCDYKVGATVQSKDRLMYNGRIFEVMYSENPAELSWFLQIRLKELV